MRKNIPVGTDKGSLDVYTLINRTFIPIRWENNEASTTQEMAQNANRKGTNNCRKVSENREEMWHYNLYVCTRKELQRKNVPKHRCKINNWLSSHLDDVSSRPAPDLTTGLLMVWIGFLGGKGLFIFNIRCWFFSFEVICFPLFC